MKNKNDSRPYFNEVHLLDTRYMLDKTPVSVKSAKDILEQKLQTPEENKITKI